ncbi:hypothetical protein [Luteimonas sp. e5]
MNMLPRHVICVLGEQGFLGNAEEVVASFGKGFEVDLEYSEEAHDGRMPRAFDVCRDRVDPSMLTEDWVAVDAHESVVYILSPPLPQETALETSADALALTSALLQSGGLAAKSESAGIAHGKSRWLALASSASGGDRRALAAAWVRRPIVDGDEFYSCGMHLLGHPDVSHREVGDEMARVQAMDRAIDGLLRGDGPHAPSIPSTRHDEDDLYFNPYGYIRVGHHD